MKCLETRTTPEGWKRRRYERDDGTRYSTLEVPASVITALGRGAAALATETWRRGEVARERAAFLKREIAARPDWKATALAHELNITEARVRQIRKGLK